MRVPLSWLREYVRFDVSAVELGRRLAISSLEVDRLIDLGVPEEGGNLDLLRVGRVVEAAKHPNADKLQLCQVDVGEGEPRQIVCGAWNFGAGATVAVALPGSRVFSRDGELFELGDVKLRGEASRGMILAEDELGIGRDHDGIMVLPDGIEPGTFLADVLPVREQVLEVAPTRNRVDLLSLVGIAREVAVVAGGELVPLEVDDPPIVHPKPVEVSVEERDGCPRYIGRTFVGVEVGPSPVWLRARLHSAGLRSISNVVDVTNYVMHVYGSPLHAFDRSKLEGGRIVVRRARDGEELQTLDGTLRRFDERDLLITDGKRPVALAAIMGGQESEVTAETQVVLLEAANFEPIGILRTSERLGLRTEGSNRWEKGVDPHLAEPASVLASRMLVDLTGAELTGSSDVHGGLPERPVVPLRPSRTDTILGLAVPEIEQQEILVGLGFDVSERWEVTVPTWRARDVTREIDVIEEVARVVLERIPRTLPRRRSVAGHLTRAQRFRRLVEDVLVGAGYNEAYTWSFDAADPDPNALRLDAASGEHAVLRTTLLNGLVEAARTNVDAGNQPIALFELARVYLPTGEALPEERWRVGGIAEGGFAAARAAVEALHATLQLPLVVRRASHPALHPAKAAAVESGWLGELHPTALDASWGVFELDLELLTAPVPARILYEDVITFPALHQDLAVVVAEEVEAGALVAVVEAAGGAELRSARVFDVYRDQRFGDDRKSVALRLAFQSPERTLTDADAAMIRERIMDALTAEFGASLRT